MTHLRGSLANQFQTLQSKEQPMDRSDGTYVTKARSGDSDASACWWNVTAAQSFV